MADNNDAKHVSHKDKQIAYHIEWEFRREAARWTNGRPIGQLLSACDGPTELDATKRGLCDSSHPKADYHLNRSRILIRMMDPLNDHMKIVNRRRNLEAAHSGVTEFTIESTNEARKRLGEDLTKLGEELIHMLQHISDIEDKMLAEMNSRITSHATRELIARFTNH